MTVYVDDMGAPLGRMKMCHMVADTSAELLAMADRIGSRREWLQCAGTYKEHFDIPLMRRRQAVAFGAVEVTRREMGAILKRKKETSMIELPEIALSVRQPWAWAIIYAGKDFENRSRGALKHLPVPEPRRIALHASKGMTRYEYESAVEFMARIGIHHPPPHKFERGGIIGTVELVRHRVHSDSRWAFGCGIELRNPEPCPFIPSQGRLGFFHWKEGPSSIVPSMAKWMLPEARRPAPPDLFA